MSEENIFEHMEKLKKDSDNLFHNFFTVHQDIELNLHTKKANVNFLSIQQKDLKTLSKINLPEMFPGESKEIEKKLKRNTLK